MSDEKVLTKEIAEQFLADEDSERISSSGIDLSDFTAIEDDALTLLRWATCIWNPQKLERNHLKNRSHFILTGLTSLSDAGAIEIFASLTMSCNSIQLPDPADLLHRRHKGEEISFGQDGLFAAFATKHWRICRSRDHQDPEDVDPDLGGEQDGIDLFEDYLKMVRELLSDRGVLTNSFQQFRDRPEGRENARYMFSLAREIDDDAASFIECDFHDYDYGDVILPVLSRISDAAAESLSRYPGDLHLELNNLPKSAAAILRKHPSLADED